MKDEDAKAAKRLRDGALRVRGAAEALGDRASQLNDSMMAHLLRLQAGILRDGAEVLDKRALAVDPPKGRA
ncbi:MAG TPA: hypothetical protein VHY32_02460 [Caulobacteraceae bacterium]|jgi:hypothetical protein|nr:hypothetical protein [Caulobacteraceae bacterium]